MTLAVLPLQQQHVEGAGALVAASYRALRQSLPDLSPAYEFEPMNHVGARFWLKRFRPVAYSLLRWIPGG
jgi:hypothetical protein